MNEDPFVNWLRQLWETKIEDRKIKNRDDFHTRLDELNAEHLRRTILHNERY